MKGSMDDKYYKIYLKTMVSYEINQLLKIYVLIFTMVSFVSFAFISALIFKISFLLLTLTPKATRKGRNGKPQS